MLSMLSPIFVFLLGAPAASGSAESSAVVAQRAAAEALEAQAMFSDAGDAYVKLADLPGVNRRSELDRAHTNYDSAYLATQNPSRLCWALQIAELVVREGAFNDEDQASYWRDTVSDDLRRLQADAQTTRRANCRFDATGAPRALVVKALTDEDFSKQTRAADRGDALKVDRPLPTEETRRWRAQTASGAILTGFGLGFIGALAGVLELQAQHARAMRRMTATAEAEGRNFTGGEWREFNAHHEDGRQLRNAAISVGVVGGLSLAAGVALLATRKRVESRKLVLQPYGGPLGGGAVLRLRF